MRFHDVLIAATLLLTGVPVAQAAVASDPVEISHGELRLRGILLRPDGQGPFAAVVAMHGCAGLVGANGTIQSRYRDWGQRLAAAGFAVLFVDSYGSRNLGNLCRTRSRSIRNDRELVADANAARRWLQGQSWVMPDRISLLGWSDGGVATLWTVRPQARVDEQAPDFRTAVALYPGCRRLNIAAWSTRVPTLILIGAADDSASAAVCRQMVAGARGRSAIAAIQVYPGAYHDFDHPNRAVQVRTGQAFSLDGSGRIHTGTNPAARADALKRVPAWFAR